MTAPTQIDSVARIGSEQPELKVSATPALALVRDVPDERWRAFPWLPLVASLIVLSTSLLHGPALTDALTGARAVGASLRLSSTYVLLAPICDVLDAISLFSQRQHVAFLVSCALSFAVWRFWQSHDGRSRRRALREEILAAAGLLGVLIAIYAGGMVLPRPTARLALSSPEAVVIDFHSHTRYSWDARSAFSPEESRRWHEASGFNVAYVTDHSTFAGAEEAALRNPQRAGDGTVLLSGIEVRDDGNHLVVLGTDARDWQSYTAGNLHEATFRQEVARHGSTPPVVLLTLPGNLRMDGSAVAVDGLEISDAAPRALAQIDSQHDALVRRARARNEALIASSNNHGWASASPAWSVMQIADWRSMTPSQLDTAIRRTILDRGYGAVRVIERRRAGPASVYAAAFTVPVAAWRLLAELSWAERMSWLIWIWVLYLVVMRRSDARSVRRTRKRSVGVEGMARVAVGALAMGVSLLLPQAARAQMLETETARPLRAGQVELSTGYEFQHSSEGNEIAVPIGIELGLSNRLGLLVEPMPYTAIRPEVGPSATGVGDLEITASYLFKRESSRLPALSLAFEEKVPTAHNNLIGTGKPDQTVYLIGSKRAGRVDFHANLGYTWVGSPPGQTLSNRATAALATEFSLTPATILYGEVLGSTGVGGEGTNSGTTPIPEAGGDQVFGSLGIAHRFHRGFQLSLGVTRDNVGAVQFRPGLTLWFR